MLNFVNICFKYFVQLNNNAMLGRKKLIFGANITENSRTYLRIIEYFKLTVFKGTDNVTFKPGSNKDAHIVLSVH